MSDDLGDDVELDALWTAMQEIPLPKSIDFWLALTVSGTTIIRQNKKRHVSEVANLLRSMADAFEAGDATRVR